VYAGDSLRPRAAMPGQLPPRLEATPLDEHGSRGAVKPYPQPPRELRLTLAGAQGAEDLRLSWPSARLRALSLFARLCAGSRRA